MRRMAAVALDMPAIAEQPQYETIAVRPLTPVIGAEIEGLTSRWICRISNSPKCARALLDWKVVFFRDQDITTEHIWTSAALWSAGDLSVLAPEAGLPRGAGHHP